METTTLISTNEALTGSEAAAVGAVAGSMFAFITVFALAYWILTIIATWKIFKKAGEPGWKAIIPIYDVYMMYKIVGMSAWFWWMLLASFVLGIIMAVDGTGNLMYASDAEIAAFDWSGHMLTVISLAIYTIAAIMVQAFYSVKTSRSFGHGMGFAIGLFILQPIFWLVLGFDKSKYNKKIAMGK